VYFAAFGVASLAAAIFATHLDERLTYSAFVAFCLVFGWRAIRSCQVVQTEDRTVIRQLIWTYKLPRASVSRFTVEAGPIWPRFRSGSFLAAELKDGKLRQFKEFSEPLGATGERDLEAVAAALNAAWSLH